LKQLIITAVIVSFLGSSLLAQQITYAPVSRQPSLLDQASAVLRNLSATPDVTVAAPAFTAAAQASPTVSRPVYKKAWFWGIVAAAAVGAVVIAASSDDEPPSECFTDPQTGAGFC
jgi:hypothetical protein